MSTRVHEGAGSGWLEFVAVLLFAVGFFRTTSAIAYFTHSHKINSVTSAAQGVVSAVQSTASSINCSNAEGS